MASELLKAHPDVGLDILDEVTEVDGPICIRQGRRDENLSLVHNRVPEVAFADGAFTQKNVEVSILAHSPVSQRGNGALTV